LLYFFFFSSRRRHTRFSRDWSSDVCSSDLPKFDKKNSQKNPRCLVCPPYICYLALLFNGLKSEDYEQNGKNRMWHKFPSKGNGSHQTHADNVLRGVQS